MLQPRLLAGIKNLYVPFASSAFKLEFVSEPRCKGPCFVSCRGKESASFPIESCERLGVGRRNATKQLDAWYSRIQCMAHPSLQTANVFSSTLSMWHRFKLVQPEWPLRAPCEGPLQISLSLLDVGAPNWRICVVAAIAVSSKCTFPHTGH